MREICGICPYNFNHCSMNAALDACKHSQKATSGAGALLPRELVGTNSGSSMPWVPNQSG